MADILQVQTFQQLMSSVRGGGTEWGGIVELLYQAITGNNKIDELPGCEPEKMKFEDFEANSEGNVKPLAKVYEAL